MFFSQKKMFFLLSKIWEKFILKKIVPVTLPIFLVISHISWVLCPASIFVCLPKLSLYHPQNTIINIEAFIIKCRYIQHLCFRNTEPYSGILTQTKSLVLRRSSLLDSKHHGHAQRQQCEANRQRVNNARRRLMILN